MYPFNKERIHRKTTLVKGFVILLSKNTIFQSSFGSGLSNKKDGQNLLCLRFLPGTNNAPDTFTRKKVSGATAENISVAID